jgi:hypothetical protein
VKEKVTIFNKINVRVALIPITFEDLPERENEKERAMETLTFSVKISDNKVKTRTYTKGGIQRKYISKEEDSSPTALTESIFVTSVVVSKEGRDMMIVNITIFDSNTN